MGSAPSTKNPERSKVEESQPTSEVVRELKKEEVLK